MLLHATCLAIGGHGVLLLGPPGAGKSDLALQLIDMPGRGAGNTILDAELVSDDQVQVTREGDRLIATAPASIAGNLEIRGQGIVSLPHRSHVILRLAIQLAEAQSIERMPEPERFELLGLAVPLVRIDPHKPSAAARVRAALLAI